MNYFFSKVRLVISRRFGYAEYESGSRIGLSCQDFKKIEIKYAKKSIFATDYG